MTPRERAQKVWNERTADFGVAQLEAAIALAELEIWKEVFLKAQDIFMREWMEKKRPNPDKEQYVIEFITWLNRRLEEYKK